MCIGQKKADKLTMKAEFRVGLISDFELGSRLRNTICELSGETAKTVLPNHDIHAILTPHVVNTSSTALSNK